MKAMTNMRSNAFWTRSKGWRRIRDRLRRQGANKTCDYVIKLIQSQPYPLCYSIRLVEHLLKRGEYEAAGRMIEAVDQSEAKNPLMDELHSTWLWCLGKPREALSFAIASARFWKTSFLVHHVGTLYRCMADRKDSPYYRRKSEHYWRLAHSLADQEEKRGAKGRHRRASVRTMPSDAKQRQERASKIGGPPSSRRTL